MRKICIALALVLFLLLSTSAVFAASNPDVIIVNPATGNTLYSDNFLISVKITKPLTIKVSVFQAMKSSGGNNVAMTLEEYEKYKADKLEITYVSAGAMDPFTTTNNLSFYTKKIENVTPGVYLVKVETLDGDGKATATNYSTVATKPKEENPADAAVFQTQQSGTSQFLKGLLKSIFGN